MNINLDEFLYSNKKYLPKPPFKNNLDAPIHRWFRYPIDFNFNVVEEYFKKYHIQNDDLVLDPFLGSGTTCVCAKNMGINSIGIDAHSFVSWIAKVKLNWEFDLIEFKFIITNHIREILTSDENIIFNDKNPLFDKIYSKDILKELYLILNIIIKEPNLVIRDFYKLALISILRKVSNSNASFPYILPKNKKLNLTNSSIKIYTEKLWLMYWDLLYITKINKKFGNVNINNGEKYGDARNFKFIDNESIDLIFTSPPYLNNIDYADCTRLEMYFLKEAKTWKDLTDLIRTKLIVSATHQAVALKISKDILPNEEFKEKTRTNLIHIKNKLSEIRNSKEKGKEYDIMCIQYFNDMYQCLNEMFRSLKTGKQCLIILGDSAPYGIYIPTDKIIKELALQIGFKNAKINILKKRGNKWNSIKGKRTHKISLRESLLILDKK
jgi:DNA modification methylase